MKTQSGNALLLVMMMMVVGSLAMQYMMHERDRRDVALTAMAWSNALKQVCAATDNYATLNWSTVSAQPTTALTMSSLTGVPPLTSDVAATVAGVSVSASITMAPVGCDPAANQCRSDVRVWTGAITGDPRQLLGNAIVARIGELASIALPENPALFVSRNHSRSDPNPANAVGAVQVRCGEVNVASSDTALRGNAAMAGALSAGSNNVSLPDAGTGVAQINLAPGAGCTETDQFALDATGKYMYCDGATWKSAAMPVTVQQTTNVYK